MRMRHAGAGLLCMGILTALPAVHAAERPSSRDTRTVVEYFYSGAEQPVLMDFQLCRGIQTSGAERYECRDPLTESALGQGMRVYAWMKFLVPKGARPTIMLRVDHNGANRDVWSRGLEAAVRYRTWHEVEFDRAGRWRIEVYDDTGREPVRLFSRTVRVD